MGLSKVAIDLGRFLVFTEENQEGFYSADMTQKVKFGPFDGPWQALQMCQNIILQERNQMATALKAAEEATAKVKAYVESEVKRLEGEVGTPTATNIIEVDFLTKKRK